MILEQKGEEKVRALQTGVTDCLIVAQGGAQRGASCKGAGSSRDMGMWA